MLVRVAVRDGEAPTCAARCGTAIPFEATAGTSVPERLRVLGVVHSTAFTQAHPECVAFSCLRAMAMWGVLVW